MHSEQTETLLQECIDKVIEEEGESTLTWNLLKRYCVVLWCSNNIELIKKYLEKIAKNEFIKDKDPNKVLLWYKIKIIIIKFIYI